ncbi:MAG: MGDG synthase family glycosyltransferase [Candidatus Acidiferrales bacterium]
MPRILILTTSHGAAHRRASEALKQALIEIEPGADVTVIDAIQRCARWFRAYYDSYLIPLRYWPSLWRRIERRQHQSSSTGPGWLFRLGGRPLFRYIADFAPDVVIATEVGVAELAAIYKRRAKVAFFLAGIELMDFNRAWVQAEVDLYAVVHADLGEELIQAGAPPARVIDPGMPIHPVYAALPERAVARSRLGIEPHSPVLLVLFGGAGFGNAGRIVAELRKVRPPVQAVFIAGKNRALEGQLASLTRNETRRTTQPTWRVLGWVSNMHEWMVAADLLLSKPGGATVMEAAACGLPLLAFDPLPGNEERTCRWLEKWGIGLWIKVAEDIAPAVERLLADPAARFALRERAREFARPRAAYETAEAILQRLPSRGGRGG